jgi:hypothetical protein
MLLPKNVQCRILAALLNERPPRGFTLAQIESLYPAFDQPWQGYLGPLLDAMDVPAGVDRSSFIASYVKICPEHRQIIAEEAERSSHIPALAELQLPEIKWLWKSWVPRGMLTVLGAVPSAGKSYLALDLAARLTAGTAFPDGSPVAEPEPVIYVDAENVPQLHNRRARAWGMDRSRLYLMGPAFNRLLVDLSQAYDQDRLVEWAWELRPALIVVDSLSAVSSRGENNVEEVRGIFSFLSRLALDYDCAVLVIHHLRKPPAHLPARPSLTIHDLRGSSHISAVSRSIIGLHWVQTGPLPDPNDPRRLEILKTNLCRYPPPMGVSFRPLAEDPEVAQVVYGQVPRAYQPTKKGECARWLVALLDQHGELAPAEVKALAEEQGFSQATLYRARRELGSVVVDTHGRQHPHNCWTLADEGSARGAETG